MKSSSCSTACTNSVLSGHKKVSEQVGQSAAHALPIFALAFASAPFSGSKMQAFVLGSVKSGGTHPVYGPEVLRAGPRHFWAHFNLLLTNVAVAVALPV